MQNQPPILIHRDEKSPNFYNNSGWPDMQIILCTINCSTKKTTYGNTINFLFVFHGHSLESLSAINLYVQLMTLIIFLYGQTMIFMFFTNFFSTSNVQFVI